MDLQSVIEKYVDDTHAIIVCDRAGHIVHFSNKAKHVLQKVALSSPHHLLPHDHAAFTKKVFEDAERIKNPHPFVIEDIKKEAHFEYVYTVCQELLFVECFDVTQNRKKEQELMQRALYDEVTGIPNRLFFFEDLEREIARAIKDERYGFGIAFLDLNDFKSMNDIHGHAFGDEYLKTFALLLSEAADADHTVYRYAGDEFVAIVRNVRSYEKMTLILKRVVYIGAEFHSVRDIPVSFAASIGSVLYTKGMTSKQMLDVADKAMYESKKRKHVESFPYTFAA